MKEQDWIEMMDELPMEFLEKELPGEEPEEETIDLEKLQKTVTAKITSGKKRRMQRAAIWVLGLVGVGIIFSQPIQAALEKLYHYIPQMGIFENEPGQIYEAKMIRQTITNEYGVTASLKDMVCKEGVLSGKIVIVDQTGEFSDVRYSMHSDEMDLIREKYKCTLHYEGYEAPLSFRGFHLSLNDFCTIYEPRFEYELKNPSEAGDIAIHIAGFDHSLAFQLQEAQAYESLDNIGTTVEKNGTTVTAMAVQEKDRIKVSYYMFPSEEVALARELNMRLYAFLAPYQYDFNQMVWLETNQQQKLQPVKQENRGENEINLYFDGDAEDFPAKLCFGPLSGTNTEETMAELPIPNIGESMELDMAVKFSMGQARIVGVSRYLSTDPNDPGDVLAIQVKWEGNTKKRRIYSAHFEPTWQLKGKNRLVSSSFDRIESETDNPMEGTDVFLYTFEKLEGDSLSFRCSNPLYWIEENIEIPLTLE